MDKERFSLLVLERNKIYFDVYTIDSVLHPQHLQFSKTCQLIMGRLKLCSKSLVFDPKDGKLQMIKIPFKDCMVNKYLANEHWRKQPAPNQVAELTLRRLMAEYRHLTFNPPVGVIAGPISEDNFFEWEALATFPRAT